MIFARNQTKVRCETDQLPYSYSQAEALMAKKSKNDCRARAFHALAQLTKVLQQLSMSRSDFCKQQLSQYR